MGISGRGRSREVSFVVFDVPNGWACGRVRSACDVICNEDVKGRTLLSSTAS